MSASPQPPDRPAPVARVLASRRAGLPPAVPLTPRLPAPLARLVPRLCDPSWLGFPGATDIDFRPILPVLGIPAIQLGDPRRAGADTRNVDDLERQVLDRMLRIFKAPPGWWGYVGSGSTAAIRHAVTTAVRQFGEVPVLYSSSGAHTCVAQDRRRAAAAAHRRPGEPRRVDRPGRAAGAGRSRPARRARRHRGHHHHGGRRRPHRVPGGAAFGRDHPALGAHRRRDRRGAAGAQPRAAPRRAAGHPGPSRQPVAVRAQVPRRPHAVFGAADAAGQRRVAGAAVHRRRRRHAGGLPLRARGHPAVVGAAHALRPRARRPRRSVPRPGRDGHRTPAAGRDHGRGATRTP